MQGNDEDSPEGYEGWAEENGEKQVERNFAKV